MSYNYPSDKYSNYLTTRILLFASKHLITTQKLTFSPQNFSQSGSSPNLTPTFAPTLLLAYVHAQVHAQNIYTIHGGTYN